MGLESGFPADVSAALAERGHDVVHEPDEQVFGGAQLIVRTEHGYVAGSDHRKDGQAGGF